MVYFTTKDFFKTIRDVKSQENLKINHARWLRNFYAAASKNFAISEKQFLIINDICNQYGFDITETVFQEETNGAN